MRNPGRDMRPIEYGWHAAEYGFELGQENGARDLKRFEFELAELARGEAVRW
jgi:hypothetical protein